jgi:hypothetical protein
MKKTIKSCLVTLLLFVGFQLAYAQPTTSAPKPIHSADDVVSFFSEHYTTEAKDPESTTWGGDYPVTITTISGSNDRILASQGNSYVVNTSNWKGQTKGNIHMDVWSESGGSFSFGLGVDFSGNIKYPQDFEWPTLIAGQWNSIDVPLIEYLKAGLNDALNLQQIRFVGKGKYYIDNIYAYGNKEEYIETVDIPVAPAPNHKAEEVKSVFSDSYTRSIKEEPKAVSYAGKTIAKIMPYKSDPKQSCITLQKLEQSGLNISTWQISSCNYIHVDVYFTGENGTGEFEFGLNSADWSGKDFKYLSDFTWPQTIAGQWVGMDIPLSNFRSLSGLNLNGIIMIQFQGSGDFYIDNLYAYQTPIDVTPPTIIPTFTLDKENVLPIFCEQYEEEGYQESEFGMTDVDSSGNMMNYGQNENQEREFVEIVEGNQTIHLTNWNDYPFKIHKNSTTMDLTDMDYLHASVYLMSGLDETNKPATVTLWMHEKDGGSVNPTDARITMQTGQWVSFSVPLCHYKEKLDLTKTYVLRLRLGGYPEMEVYLDNVFAYKGEPIGLLAKDCDVNPDPDEPIFDKTAGTLSPADWAYMGVNLASASGGTVPGVMGSNYAMPKFEDLWYFKAKGVRLVRFPFRWKRIQSEIGGPLVLKDIEAMKEVVAEAERLGIWVMLDMHDYAEYTRNDTLFTIDGRYKAKNTSGNWGPWKSTPEGTGVGKEAFADVWVKLANEFKGFTNMWGYDLMNEPKDVDINGLKNTYQYVIDEIRKVDTKTAIVIEGKNYANASAWPNVSDELKNLTDPIGNNIIYQAHTYFDKDNSGTYQQDYDTEVGTNAEVYKQRLDPFINWLKENGKRGMIGEFGVPYNGAKNSDPRYMELIENTFAYMKEKQLTGTYWCAGNWYENNHITVQPAKDYYTEKSTMKIMEKYTWNFNDRETGIENPIQNINSEVSVFPNPVVNTLTVEAKEAINSISIFNLFGQIVFEQKQSGEEKKCNIDFESYADGNYLIQVILQNGKSSVQRLIKK